MIQEEQHFLAICTCLRLTGTLTGTMCDVTCSHNLVFSVNTKWLEVTTLLRGRSETDVVMS